MTTIVSDAVLQMIQAPGSYGFICAMNDSPPFLCHEPHGVVLHTVTPEEHAAMLKRAHR